jgi:hypothetical protein
MEYLRKRIDASLHQVKNVPIVAVSALKGPLSHSFPLSASVVVLMRFTGNNVDKLVRTAIGVHDKWNLRIPTSHLNAWVRYVLSFLSLFLCSENRSCAETVQTRDCAPHTTDAHPLCDSGRLRSFLSARGSVLTTALIRSKPVHQRLSYFVGAVLV